MLWDWLMLDNVTYSVQSIGCTGWYGVSKKGHLGLNPAVLYLTDSTILRQVPQWGVCSELFWT